MPRPLILSGLGMVNFFPWGAKLVCALPFQYKLFYSTISFIEEVFFHSLFIFDLLAEG